MKTKAFELLDKLSTTQSLTPDEYKFLVENYNAENAEYANNITTEAMTYVAGIFFTS